MANQIRPYNGEVYNVFPWGSSGYIDGSTNIAVTYYTNQVLTALLYVRYSIFNRYTGSELNIEDIYSNVTARSMALGCMDGPMLAYSSTAEGD